MAMTISEPKTIKLIVGTVIMITITLIWYFTSYTKNADIIKLKSDRLEQLRGELLEAKRQAADYENIRARCDSIFTFYKSMEALMSTSRDVPTFLKEIAGAAKNAGILLKNVNILPPTKASFYEINPYSVYISADFNAMGIFLETLANRKHLTNFDNFSIMSKVSGTYTIESSFTIYTYTLPKEGILVVPQALKEKPPKFKPFPRGKK